MEQNNQPAGKEQCPACGAPCTTSWIGLDLVENTGDETLAHRVYKYEPPALSQPVQTDWISVEKELPKVGKPVIAIAEYMHRDKPESATLYCYLAENGDCVLLPDEDDYGWKFAEVITYYIYADKIIPQPPNTINS